MRLQLVPGDLGGVKGFTQLFAKDVKLDLDTFGLVTAREEPEPESFWFLELCDQKKL